MARRFLGLLLLCSLAVAAFADDVDESAVVVLTDKNFEEKLGSAKYARKPGGWPFFWRA